MPFPIRWCIVHDEKGHQNADRWFCAVDWGCVVVDAEIRLLTGKVT